MVVREDLEDNNSIDLLLTRTGTGVVENEARDEKIEVATEEEVRAGADDHCTEQDEKVRVGADKSEARDGRFNTDADADNSTLESRGRTISRGTENPNRTTRGDEENTGGVVTEDGMVNAQGGRGSE